MREWLDAPDAGGELIWSGNQVEDLDRLCDGITSDNLHGEVSFGTPVGKEILEWRIGMQPVLAVFDRALQNMVAMDGPFEY